MGFMSINQQISCQLNKYDVFLIKLGAEIFIFVTQIYEKLLSS